MSHKEPRRIIARRRDSLTGKAQGAPWYPRIGDWVSKALASIPFVRLTPKKWRELKVRCGLSGACSCVERQIGLNRFGRWVVKPFRRAWKALLPAPPAE